LIERGLIRPLQRIGDRGLICWDIRTDKTGFADGKGAEESYATTLQRDRKVHTRYHAGGGMTVGDQRCGSGDFRLGKLGEKGGWSDH